MWLVHWTCGEPHLKESRNISGVCVWVTHTHIPHHLFPQYFNRLLVMALIIFTHMSLWEATLNSMKHFLKSGYLWTSPNFPETRRDDNWEIVCLVLVFKKRQTGGRSIRSVYDDWWCTFSVVKAFPLTVKTLNCSNYCSSSGFQVSLDGGVWSSFYLARWCGKPPDNVEVVQHLLRLKGLQPFLKRWPALVSKRSQADTVINLCAVSVSKLDCLQSSEGGSSCEKRG